MISKALSLIVFISSSKSAITSVLRFLRLPSSLVNLDTLHFFILLEPFFIASQAAFSPFLKSVEVLSVKAFDQVTGTVVKRVITASFITCLLSSGESSSRLLRNSSTTFWSRFSTISLICSVETKSIRD